MRSVTFVEKHWELMFAFTPIVLGLVAWLTMGLMGALFNFPAPFDMDVYTPGTFAERIGAGAYGLSTSVVMICYLIWLPFLTVGLTAFTLRKLWLRYLSKKSSGLQDRINELRKKNAQD